MHQEAIIWETQAQPHFWEGGGGEDGREPYFNAVNWLLTLKKSNAQVQLQTLDPGYKI